MIKSREKIFLIFFGILLSLIFLETAVKFLLIKTPYQVGLYSVDRDKWTIEDPDLGYKIKPDAFVTRKFIGDNKYWSASSVSVKFDDVGFRSNGGDSVPSGKPFAIALGDSATEGYCMEDSKTWVSLLEKGMGRDIINMGVGGYGTIQEVEMYEKYGRQLKPEIVFLLFDTGDPEDDEKYEKINGQSYGVGQFLYENSVTYNLVSRFVYYARTFTDSTVDTLHYKNGSVEYYFFSYYTEELSEDLNDTFYHIGRLKNMTVEDNSELIVMYFPFRELVYEDESGQRFEEEHRQNKKFADFCRENDIHYIDLIPAFMERKNEQLYPAIDGHLNENGNQLQAEIMLDYLEKNNLINMSHANAGT